SNSGGEPRAVRQTAAFALDFFVLLGQAKRTRKKTLALYKIPKNFSFISITAAKLYFHLIKKDLLKY
ncbi:hypothetical protein, partial [Ornithobacterium rhinotracheale]